MNVYSYNQLLVILNYFEDDAPITDIDVQLCSIFKGCPNVKSAKTQLEYLGSEPFSKDLWKVAKTLDWRKSGKGQKLVSQGVEIHKGNIIKMGRLKMRLMSMKLLGDSHSQSVRNEKKHSHPQPMALQKMQEVSQEDDAIDLKDISYVMSDQSDEIPPCRFCLSNVMDDKNNPLINPCNCKGTQGLLHLDCLKSWMESRRTHKVFSQYSEMYNWKTLHCELCQSPYPFKICFGGKTESLLDYDTPDEPHLAFETFLKEGSDKATSKSVYVLRITDVGNYKIGRSHDVEFHVEDISVSRFHGEIQITRDKVFMQDYKSKYGTQILIKGTQALDLNDPTKNMFQVGRAWLMASYTKKSNKGLFSCCFQKPNRDDSIERNHSKIEKSGQRHDTHGNMLDSQLFSKLEQDIENLQKDRDSVFYLDDEFYNKLIGIYINPDKKEVKKANRRPTEVYENRETIDDVKLAESKEEEPESSSRSEDNNSNSSDEFEESGESESMLGSISCQIEEPSMEGIGMANQKSVLLSRTPNFERAIPK